MIERGRPFYSTADAGAAPGDELAGPRLHVAPAPHLSTSALTTRRMMLDVVIGLAPVVGMAIYVFEWYAVMHVALATLACLAAEYLFTRVRGKASQLGDFSAAVTGVILGLSLPWSAPWYVPIIAGFMGIGLGKVVFGGLGQNLFNPAMVGRAFVMIAFPAALGAAAYTVGDASIGALTQATPLTLAKQAGENTAWWPMFLGTTNGSLGETSIIAALLGGLYLCFRRAASWEIPASLLGTVALLGLAHQLIVPDTALTMAHHLLGGALVFGAFFIATDPVSTPLSPRGKVIFGVGCGFLIWVMRVYSGYPEGLMFAILLMNALTPLINRFNIPTPLGGPIPQKK